MADLYSNQYQRAYVDKPKGKLAPAELNGRMRRMFVDVTLGAEITTADRLFMAKLPANVVIREVRMVAAGGTAGTLDLGWLAGEKEAADADGIFANIAGNAAVDLTMDISNQAVAFNKRFQEEVDLVLSASVDTVGWNGDLVQLEIVYVID